MSLFCYGAFVAIDGLLYTFYDMDRLDVWNELNEWQKMVLKPVIGCITCAATFWGNIAYFLMFDFNFGYWLVSWVGCAGLNWMISKHYDI